ncbi:MAG: helix-turn-helix transcriptional regulator [Saprospiraceae bacterium]|nr:helix-turn-helix transcriptional regulator [Saprospiraceae bacterium]
MKTTSKKISNREKEIIRLIASELTTKEIADRLFISEETVKSHRKNIMIKIHAKNTAGLIYKSIAQNILNINSLLEASNLSARNALPQVSVLRNLRITNTLNMILRDKCATI